MSISSEFANASPVVAASYPDKTSEVIHLARQLIEIPSVTVGAAVRDGEVQRAARFIRTYLEMHNVPVRVFDQGRYPAILASLPGRETAPVMLSGHYDVVAPEPDDSQFVTRIEGDYLWGRGAADMKTVVATYLVWLKDAVQAGPPYPAVNLLLVGNEENGETEPMGTPHVLAELRREGYTPALFIAGERTEESGSQLWGEICVENRGVGHFAVVVRGRKAHSGMASAQADLTQRLIEARTHLTGLAAQYLTLSGGPWKSQMRYPFFQVGAAGVYNITPDYGVLGVEIRSIPQDNLKTMLARFAEFCKANDLELEDFLVDDGIACDPASPYLALLVEAVSSVSGEPARLGKKLAGTSARFAPGGNGLVWGQSGIGPHASDERHYLPSIEPYYRALAAFGALTLRMHP